MDEGKREGGEPKTTAGAPYRQQGGEGASEDLDAQLAERLEDTLDAGTKRELQAEAVLDRLRRPDEDEEDVASAEPADDEGDGADRSDGASDDLVTETDVEAAVTLARIAFRDGEYFEFLAVPGDGEIGLAYVGDDDRRWSALDGEFLSPLRLYCSLAPPRCPASLVARRRRQAG